MDQQERRSGQCCFSRVSIRLSSILRIKQPVNAVCGRIACTNRFFRKGSCRPGVSR